MYKEIKRTLINNVMRVTTLNERWYAEEIKDEAGLPVFRYVPSVTWIADHYPKGVGFYKWLADKGWDQAEALREAAGDKGTKVHQATENIEMGWEVKMTDKYPNPSTGQEEELSLEEYEAVMSFAKWLDKEKPVLLSSEKSIIGKDFAGTIDRVYFMKDETWIVDLKTSANLYPTHEIQVSAYKKLYLAMHRVPETTVRLGILQLGYKRNKDGFKFTEVEDKFDLFQASYKIWQNENPDAKPKERDYPLSVKAECRQLKEKANG